MLFKLLGGFHFLLVVQIVLLTCIMQRSDVSFISFDSTLLLLLLPPCMHIYHSTVSGSAITAALSQLLNVVHWCNIAYYICKSENKTDKKNKIRWIDLIEKVFPEPLSHY